MYFDQKRTTGALGTLIAARWYKGCHPQSLLISLDSREARKWMSLDEDAQRADLLGLSINDGEPTIDLIEVKSGEDARTVYALRENELTGRPVEQLINTARSVEGIFRLNDLQNHVLTPPRREILRLHLYRQGFSGTKDPAEKQAWGETLNSLFKGDVRPTIRLNLVVVNFGINQVPVDRACDALGYSVRLVHLNEESVNLHLGPAVSVTDGSAGANQPEPAVVSPSEDEGSAGELEKKELPKLRVDLAQIVETTCQKLRAACEDFQIRVTEIDPEIVDVGPSIIRYKVRLAPGEQGEKLRRNAENIARQLAADSVPMIDRLPGTHYMYIDLGRPDREVVPLEPLLAGTSIADVNELPLHIGVDPAGKAHRLDLGDDRLPHLLVAGGTGSGKTIFLYSVVLSLVAAHRPETLELLIIDPKQTDFTVFSKLGHLRKGEVVSEAQRGVELLRSIANEDMAERSRVLQDARQRDIKAYNSLFPKNPIRPLVVVIDEYADLVAVLPKKEREQFDLVISRLAARGRNVGIHLVVATQRPTADVITGNIKANMPCRVSFSLPSSRDSQVILDEPGAERLLRKGDMLLMMEGHLTRLQGYYTDTTQLEALLKRFEGPPSAVVSRAKGAKKR